MENFNSPQTSRSWPRLEIQMSSAVDVVRAIRYIFGGPRHPRPEEQLQAYCQLGCEHDPPRPVHQEGEGWR